MKLDKPCRTSKLYNNMDWQLPFYQEMQIRSLFNMTETNKNPEKMILNFWTLNMVIFLKGTTTTDIISQFKDLLKSNNVKICHEYSHQ